ncbi:heparin lyase I family protein [Thetidibacter halocola]|uniref:Heparin lyase I family protein n=1 Tax=Thetidibacter halocola TaxID=2827239 RepID=A0A8J7WE22_9RHOB|nr:heparin lyase I family protein [Thetidibacter halocola]MBS0123418.1 heparin lyase I family protein [Thetidibacter halocola]
MAFRGLMTVILASILSACLPVIGFRTAEPVDAPAGYERFFSPAPHAFRFVEARVGEPARRGDRAERFELRDGDCGGSDCGNPRYRAEIRMLDDTIRARSGEDIWYGWSLYNASLPAFERRDSLRVVLGQWTMGGGVSPAIRLIQLGADEGNWTECTQAVCAGPETASGDVAIQLEDLRRALDWGPAQNDGYVCRLFDSQQARNRWTDITLNTNFASGLDGYLRVWVNGVLKCDYRGPVVSQNSLLESLRPEHRRGVFVSYSKRWEDTHPGRPKPTLIVYYDEFRVGRSRADVDVFMLERAGVAPVD